MDITAAAFSLGDVIAGLIANAATAAAAGSVGAIAGGRKRAEQFRRNLQRYAPMTSRIQWAATKAARSVQSVNGIDADQLKLFLVSTEAECIVRDIFAARLSEAPILAVSLARELFAESFSSHFEVSDASISEIVEILVSEIIEACDEAIKYAYESRLFYRAEDNSISRHSTIAAQLGTLEKTLQEIRDVGTTVDPSANSFISHYSKNASARFGTLKPASLETERRVPIDEIYVKPSFRMTRTQADKLGLSCDDKGYVGLADLMFGLHRTVVLGDPGAGKTTCATKICHEVLNSATERPVGGRNLVPFFIVLKDYARWRQDHESSILQFIVSRCLLQIPARVETIHCLLRSGRGLVVFDGLDELLETSSRVEVRDDVESFCHTYGSTPVLVTSRSVGYQLAPLSDELFQTLRIADFSEERGEIPEYVTKWFTLDSSLNDEHHESIVAAFLEESKVVADIRNNPLMLSLMCNLYRGEGFIPRNRPDVYAKCSTMLYETWDNKRGIRKELPFEAHIGPLLRHLADWIYSDEALQRGVSEDLLIQKSANYLAEYAFDEVDIANHYAKQFLDHCSGRAWVFSDTGTTETGDRIFQFTHRTFLEYFAADNWVRTNPTADLLFKKIAESIETGSATIATELSCQLLARRVEGAADEILSEAISTGEQPMIEFCSLSLRYLTPRPSTIQLVVSTVIENAVNQSQTRAAAMLDALIVSRPENLDYVLRILEQKIHSLLEGTNVISAACGAEMLLHWRRVTTVTREKPLKFLQDLQEKYHDSGIAALAAASPVSQFACHQSLQNSTVTVEKAVEYHGFEIFLSQIAYGVFIDDKALSFIALAIANGRKEVFEYLADIFISSERPTIGFAAATDLRHSLAYLNGAQVTSRASKLNDRNCIFAVCVVYLIAREQDMNRTAALSENLNKVDYDVYLKRLISVWVPHPASDYEATDDRLLTRTEKVERIGRRANLSNSQIEFLQSYAQRDFTLIKSDVT